MTIAFAVMSVIAALEFCVILGLWLAVEDLKS